MKYENLITLGSSFLDPDLVTSETFGRIRKKSFWIPSGQLLIRNEFEIKLRYSYKLQSHKIHNFSTKFLLKKFLKKLEVEKN
jgi:hypothetical protein